MHKSFLIYLDAWRGRRQSDKLALPIAFIKGKRSFPLWQELVLQLKTQVWVLPSPRNWSVGVGVCNLKR